jgi:hypothetical protein
MFLKLVYFFLLFSRPSMTTTVHRFKNTSDQISHKWFKLWKMHGTKTLPMLKHRQTSEADLTSTFILLVLFSTQNQ